jgi:ubiquinone/menaquinone biosynthesis C-methylase UbiE
MTGPDPTQARFAATASRMAALADRRVEGLRRRFRELLALTGAERALDVGTGTGPLALALAPLVREVVGLDPVPEMLAEARARAAACPNASFVLGDAHDLPFAGGRFDVAVCGRTLHHVDRVDEVVAELARVTRPGGRVLVLDQIAWADPEAAELQERIERRRDPSHVRTLRDSELRALLSASGLLLERAELEEEERELAAFLSAAGCENEGRVAVLELVEQAVGAGQGAGLRLRREEGGFRFATRVGWYVARRSGGT